MGFRVRTLVKIGFLCSCLLAASAWNFARSFFNELEHKDFQQSHLAGRSLLGLLPNCTPRAIQQFPSDLFTLEQKRSGAVILHFCVALYMFLGFALLCDDYFLPSLEVICDALHIQSDVAGATFMAAGSSAPELATSVIAVFIAKDDIGVGTVVGSAVFNIMFVISVCALFAGMVVELNWWPLFRDSFFYTISVAALALVILDEKVYWYEAGIFMLLYMLYILLMYFNQSLEAWFVPRFTCCKRPISKNIPEVGIIIDGEHTEENGQQTSGTTMKESIFMAQDEFDSDYEEEMENTKIPLIGMNKEASKTAAVNINDGKEVPQRVFTFPNVWWKKVIWIMSLPLKCLFFITIPDCRFPRFQRCFVITFIMSLVWLSLLSYLMVWMITSVGYTLGISDSIMGLTFIAFGVSLPDLITSLIVVREGLGDMAISNAVGSNVFDILICLGLPWLLKIAINVGEPIQVYSAGLTYSTLTLLGTVLFLLVVTHLNSWRLTKMFGVILMVVYVIFTVLSALYELNIFGYFHPQECV